MSNFYIFYDARSPNMAMSRDPRSKFRKKFYFFRILHLILGRAAKFVAEKLSTSEVISQKTSPQNSVQSFDRKTQSSIFPRNKATEQNKFNSCEKYKHLNKTVAETFLIRPKSVSKVLSPRL